MAVTFLFLACLWGLFGASDTKDYGRIRLVNGPHRCSGRVEILHFGLWGTICDDHWDIQDARVVCRQLGCGAAVSALLRSHFGTRSGIIWLDDVGCAGTESMLHQCPARPWGQNDCNHGEDAGVICSAPGNMATSMAGGIAESPRTSETPLLGVFLTKLMNGTNSCSGRVEVFHNGEWGTVCDDQWDIRDARAVCQHLGCGAAKAAPGNAYFGCGNGRIWLDEVQCTGTESDLSQCRANPFGLNNCHHGEDAGVVCSDAPEDIATSMAGDIAESPTISETPLLATSPTTRSWLRHTTELPQMPLEICQPQWLEM